MAASHHATAQTPVRGEIFLDHVGWYVPDMDAAGAAFTRLGFGLTPFVAHTNADPAGGPPVPSGTGNRCAMLARGYIEILAAMPGAETKLAVQLRAGLKRYTGIHLIAFTVADADAARARLGKDGFDPLPMVHLRRPIETNRGEAGEVGFEVVRLPPDAMAEGRIQTLTQVTPGLVWQDRFITRRNGITELSGVLVCSHDPAEAASRFARYIGRPAAHAGNRWSIALDRGGLEFAAPGHCSTMVPGIDIPATPFIAALALASEDVAATAQNFDADRIPYGRIDDTLHIAAADALGATLIVHPVGEAWLPR